MRNRYLHAMLVVALLALTVGCGSGSQEPTQAEPYCGDGICDEVERRSGKCPRDCAQQPLAEPLAESPIPEREEVQSSASSLYLSVVVHVEEDLHKGKPKAGVPDYDGSEAMFLHFAKAMREFAEIVATHGAKVNFGTEWTFSEGARKYDPAFYSDLEAMGHEIDAHAHESFVPYHEVREYIGNAGGDATDVASGMKEEDILEEMEYFDKYYPDFQILWGVAFAGHGQGEVIAGWVWRPSRVNWLEHDPDGRYIYVGHGEMVNSVEAIETAIGAREPNRINTYSVFASPRDFKAAKGAVGIPPEWTTSTENHDYWENRLKWWDSFFTELDGFAAQGQLEYASLSEVAGVFAGSEHSLDFDGGEPPRSDRPYPARNRAAGYYP